jgi:hypothetical protein
MAAPWHGVGPWPTPFRRPSAYIFPSMGKPKRPDQFSTKPTASRRHHRCEIGRVQKLFLAPCRRGESPPEAFFITMAHFVIVLLYFIFVCIVLSKIQKK